VIIFAVLAIVVIAGSFGAVRVSKLFEPKQRVVFWIVVVIAAALVLPQLFRGFMAGYRAAAEIRQQQGR
jgi:hypothetical protein